MNHRLLTATLVALTSVWLPSATDAAIAVYDYEGLTTGELGGRDNWVTLSGTTSQNVTAGIGYNTTTVSQAAYTASINSRLNDGSFGIPSLAGKSAAIFEFDVRPGIDSNKMAMFGPGADANTNGTLEYLGSEVAFYFGISGGTFRIRNLDNVFDRTTPLPASIAGANGTDWVTLRLEVDLLANGGDGSYSMFYKNLTDGDTVFTAVAGVDFQNANLGLLATGHPLPATWNGLFTDFRYDAMGDNLSVDNLPEPSTLVLVMLAGAGMLARRRR